MTAKTIVMITNSVEEALILGMRVFTMSDMPSSVSGVWDINIPFANRAGDINKSPEFEYLRHEIREARDKRFDINRGGRSVE